MFIICDKGEVYEWTGVSGVGASFWTRLDSRMASFQN